MITLDHTAKQHCKMIVLMNLKIKNVLFWRGSKVSLIETFDIGSPM